MKKGEIVEEMAQQAGITKAEASKALDSLLQGIGKAFPLAKKWGVATFADSSKSRVLVLLVFIPSG